MISKEEIKKLADLARIDMGDEEIENLRSEMDAILDYVGQVKSIQGLHPDEARPKGVAEEGLGVINVMRDDTDPTDSETHSKELIAEFPESENNYLRVKKIL